MEPMTVLAALLIAVGIAGLVIPVLPGLALTLVGVLVWAIGNGTTTAWVVFGICVVLGLIGWVVQYTVPGRRMKRAGVPTRALVIGAVAAVIGFFVIPVVGLFVGFVLGVMVGEYLRLRDPAAAWAQTIAASKGVLLSIGIELAAAVTIAVVWVVGLLATR
ncbi:DUF456 domain-containing protein [Dermacoccaceae bacterium W4C1]